MRSVATALAAMLLGLGSLCADVQAATELYVATSGDDADPGTREKPLATVGRAKQAVRERIAAGLTSDVVVWIGEGTYRLDETLVFGPEDSGTEQFAVAYRACAGAKVTLSGGRPITGWRKSDGEVWSATVPGVTKGWTFRNLFVDGRRAVRARTPNVDAEPNGRQLKAVEMTKDRARFTVTLEPGVLGDWKNPSDVELMIAGNWAINRKRVERIDHVANVATLAPPHQHGPAYIFPSAGRWYHVENARELLDQPGEWYLDRTTGIVSYLPREGEDMTSAEVVAPVLEQLVVVAGTREEPVRNLHFLGIRFEHTDWRLPDEGYMGIQACHYGRHPHRGRRWLHVPAAVCLTDAQGCSVEDGVLARLCGSGVELADRCRDGAIRGNRLFEISANGIMVGGPRDEADVPKANEVSNNHVHGCGLEYYGAIGIWVGFAQGIRVAHNLVHDLPYSGISVGWEWNDRPTACRENLVEANHVYDVMKRLCDGGCIYTLGLQPGTVIRANHLHAVHRSFMAQGAPNNGMFIDQGSKGYLFERNVIYNTAAEHVRFNQCQRDWRTWRDNHFGHPDAVKQSGAAIIAQAGLEPAYRERLLGEP